jgi:hypothetical protein
MKTEKEMRATTTSRKTRMKTKRHSTFFILKERLNMSVHSNFLSYWLFSFIISEIVSSIKEFK